MTEIRQAKDYQLPCPAEILVPHRPPMLFIDSLIERLADRATASAVVPENGICFDPVQGVLPEFFIEVIAQTMAAVNGYDALCDGKKTHDGFLVGIDEFSFGGTPTAGRTIRIEIEKTFEFGAVKIIRGQVFDEDILLASGTIKVWENEVSDG